MAPTNIEPKPTTYAGITFRSRLEARWAVLLDYHPAVEHWQYEPTKYTLPNGWDYVPDFLFSMGGSFTFLEVKPEFPNDEYVTVLQQFVPHLPHQLLIGTGGFYNEEPQVWSLLAKDHKGVRAIAYRLFVPTDVLHAAQRFRFDLPNGRRPSFRGGSAEEVGEHIHNWRKHERNKRQQSRKRGKGK